MWEEARDELERLRAAGLLPPGLEARTRAAILYDSGRYEEVIALSRLYDAEAHGLQVPLARAYAKRGDLDQARQTAAQALEKRRPGAELAMGDVCAASGDLDAALRLYERAARHLVRVDGLRAAGRTLMLLGDYGEAAVVLEQAVRSSDTLNLEDLSRLAECLRRAGRERVAREVERLARERNGVESA